MRLVLMTFSLLTLVGCATHPTVVVVAPPPPPLAAVTSTKMVETRYEVRGYRESANPSIRHEAHVVYRQTRVPLNAEASDETVPRTTYPPASYAPLPATAELNAELANQKAITAELRAMKASMAETQQRMETQYAQLARQGAEAAKVRGELEVERRRLRASTPAPQADVAASNGDTASEVKW